MKENTPTTPEPETPPPPPACELLFCGSTKWDLLGRKTVPKSVLSRGGSATGTDLLAPTRLPFAPKLAAVFSGCAAAHLILVDTAGRAYGLGRNDLGQLAQPDLRSRPRPTLLALPASAPAERVLHAACGRAHTVLVTSKGRVLTAGNNASGQLANGSRTELRKAHVPAWQVVQLPDGERAVCAAAGADFTALACASGAVYCAGSGQYGQLGNGRTGECIETGNRIAFDVVTKPLRVAFDPAAGHVRIVQVACGTNHTLALDADGKVWSWGWGGYGRLGHKTPKDEMRPRRVEAFAGPNYRLDLVACGQASSFAVQRNRKSCYMWGMTKRTGECNMYPKPQFDLQGWEIRSIASGSTSTVVASERSVISWGASPTFGELGYGEGKPKSSTKPKVMESLEGLCATQVAEGQAFTAILVRVEGEEDRKIFDALPMYEFEDEEEDGAAEEPGEKRKSAKNAKGQPKAKSRKKRR